MGSAGLRIHLAPIFFMSSRLILFLVAGATLQASPEAVPASDAASVVAAEALAALPKYKSGDSAAVPDAVLEKIRRGSPEERAALEPKLLGILKDPATTPAAKEYILRWLGWMGSDLSVPVLAEIAASPTGDGGAIRALATIPSAKSDAALLALLKTAPAERKVAVIGALGLRQSAAAVPALARIATGKFPALAEAAMNALASIATKEALRAILQADAGKNPEAKSRALIAAASNFLLRGKEPLPAPVSKALREILLSKSQPSLCIAAARLLIPKNGVPDVVSLVKSEDYRLREGAAKALAEAIPVTGLAKIDWAPDTWGVVLHLITAKATPGDLPLFQKALGSPDARITSAAIAGIGACAAPETLDILLPIAAGSDIPARDAAIKALATSKFPGGNEKLLSAFNAGQAPATRALLLKVMAERQQHEAFQPALEAAKSSDAVMRPAGYAALSKLAGRGNLPGLAALMENVPASDAQNLRTAVVRAAALDPSPPDAVRTLADAHAKAGAKQKADIVNILVALNVPESEAALRSLLDGQDIEVRKDVIRALAAARNKTSCNLLPGIAENAPGETERILALKGYIDTIGTFEGIPLQKKAAAYRIAWKFAARDEEKEAIRAAVRKIDKPDAVAFLREIAPPENPPPAQPGT